MTEQLELVGPKVVDVNQVGDNDQRCWSVTTIIGALDKPALVYWAAAQTAEAAIDDLDIWQPMVEKGRRNDAVRWLTGARFRTPDGERSASELGTAVHAACEEYALSGNRPDVDDEVRPFLNQFDEWLNRFQPEYQATETTVYSPKYGYAGTCDAFLTIDGVPLIADYKTTKKAVDKRGNPTTPYPEAALQLAAYRYAEVAAIWRPRRYESFRRRYYLLSRQERDEAVPVPAVEGGVVIHITPEHCEAFPVRCDASVHDAFLYVLEAARWSFETSKRVVGDVMTRPEVA